MKTPMNGLPPSIHPYGQEGQLVYPKQEDLDQLAERVRLFLAERFDGAQDHVEVASAPGAIGIFAGHTHYSPGFAVFMPLTQGIAVGLQEARGPVSKISFEGSPNVWEFDMTSSVSKGNRQRWPAWVCAVEEMMRYLATDRRQMEVAIVNTIQPSCTDAYMGALAIATARAMVAHCARPETINQLLPALEKILASCLRMPFSMGYLMASEAGTPRSFSLLDTTSMEHMILPPLSQDLLGWGMIDTGRGMVNKATIHVERKEKVEAALAILRQKGYTHLKSLNDIEHRELHPVLSQLPRNLKPIVQHLITESSRIRQLLVALHKQDWQKVGTLLLISHASLREEWKQTNEEVDFVVAHLKSMSLEGLYGARVTGRSSCVIVVGQPQVVPQCLLQIQAAFEERYGYRPEALLL